jgi:TetR/AcrR family transcriptional regulator, copper-responsive repressor
MTQHRAALASQRRRGRPRSFDDITTLPRIRSCFAQHGFKGTSLDDLVSATGLARPSLYAAYGDKRAIFLRALESEYEEVCTRLSRQDEAAPLAVRIARFLEAATAGYAVEDPERTPAALAFGAALAEAAIDEEIRAWLHRFSAALDEGARKVLGQASSWQAVSLLSAFALALCVRTRARSSLSEAIDLEELASLLGQ